MEKVEFIILLQNGGHAGVISLKYPGHRSKQDQPSLGSIHLVFCREMIPLVNFTRLHSQTIFSRQILELK